MLIRLFNQKSYSITYGGRNTVHPTRVVDLIGFGDFQLAQNSQRNYNFEDKEKKGVI